MGMTNFGVSLALCAALLGRVAEAQQTDPWDYRAPGITRQQLEGVLARFEAAAQSPAYSEGLRARARADADSVRARLRDGDLRVGDRLRISVDGQPQLTDTSAVITAGPALEMPGIGTVPFDGVLRSEVEAHLSRNVDRVYRGAVARVRLLTRLVVVGGGVLRPGFYGIPSDALLSDAIAAAGGLVADVRLDEAYVERGRDRLWQPDSLRVAMREARTIGDLGMRDGDRVVVPRKGSVDLQRLVQVVSLAASLPFTLIALRGLL